jgi:hypothetical protein
MKNDQVSEGHHFKECSVLFPHFEVWMVYVPRIVGLDIELVTQKESWIFACYLFFIFYLTV